MLALILLLGCSCIVGLQFAAHLSAAEPPITAATFSPDGMSIVIGSQRGLRVCSWPDLAEQCWLDSQLIQVHDLAFSPDGTVLAAVGGRPAEAGHIELFGWPQASLLHRRQFGEDVAYQVAWQTATGPIAVAGPDQGITLLDRAANTLHHIAGHSQDVVAIDYLPDGHLLSGSRDSTIRVWKFSELIRTLNNHTREIHDLAVHPGSTQSPWVIASSGADRTVRFWWPARGRLMRFAKLPSPALEIAWTVDGTSLVAACADGHLRVIAYDSVEITQDIDAASGWLHTLAVAPNGTHVFVGGSEGRIQAVKIR